MTTVTSAIEIQTTTDTLTFSVYVQPRSSSAAIVGVHNNALKIKLTAPPADGAANKQCCKLIAKVLSLPKSAVEIVSGHTSRHKRIRIHLAGGRDDHGDHGHPGKIKALADKVRSLAQ